MDCSWRFWTTWSLLGQKSVVPNIMGCAHLSLLAPIETINKRDSKKKRKKEKKKKSNSS